MDQQLSHRRRLTQKWEIQEFVEERFVSLMARFRESGSAGGETKKASMERFLRLHAIVLFI